MAKFMMIYHGGTPPKSPEEGQAMMGKWKAWMGANMDALVEPQNPVGVFQSVRADGVHTQSPYKPMSGYSVVEAADIDAAIALAQSCPFLEMDQSSIEVGEIKQM